MFERLRLDVRFWAAAAVVGLISGVLAVAFRLLVELLQRWAYGIDAEQIARAAPQIPWWVILTVPVCGGALVALIMRGAADGGRSHAMADVIEAAALKDGKLDLHQGWRSALASIVTLSFGGSTGREGPVVHIGGLVATMMSRFAIFNTTNAHNLLACAAAAAVSAGFNAPIAGMIFAMEVVLRHYAMHAFAPIVIASVLGSVVSRIWVGDALEFTTPMQALAFYAELPAFLLLGVLCGIVALIFMRAIFIADDTATQVMTRLRLPAWMRPMIGGLGLGLIALQFPHVIGVGYETTSRALLADIDVLSAVVFVCAKTIAAALTLGARMGGGVFSPALMLGALSGVAYGSVATWLLPAHSGEVSLYALAGMGGVAAALLGAPISTIVIVFELTGNWSVGIAVMATVSISTAVFNRFSEGSIFLRQLRRRDLNLYAGPHVYLQSSLPVADLIWREGMQNEALRKAAEEMMAEGISVGDGASLAAALPLFEESGRSFLPVVRAHVNGPELVGVLYHLHAVKAFNAALIERSREEHVHDGKWRG